MYILFFLLWIAFNGRITLEIIIFGLVISAAMYGFICKFMDYSLRKDLAILKKSGLIIEYACILIWEIIKANIATLKMILSSRYIIEPTIVHFRTDLKTNMARVVLANSITLTPGTITVSLEKEIFTVHCLDKDFSDGLSDSIFVRMLERIEKMED